MTHDEIYMLAHDLAVVAPKRSASVEKHKQHYLCCEAVASGCKFLKKTLSIEGFLAVAYPIENRIAGICPTEIEGT